MLCTGSIFNAVPDACLLRADDLAESTGASLSHGPQDEERWLRELGTIISSPSSPVPCPSCGESDWTPPRVFNLLFQTRVGHEQQTYLRPETAQVDLSSPQC